MLPIMVIAKVGSSWKGQTMAKLYNFNMNRNGHNIDTALVILRNRMYDAEAAGDHEAVKRLWARHERICEITGSCGVGMLKLPWDEWQYLHTVSEWVKCWRASICDANGIEYVE